MLTGEQFMNATGGVVALVVGVHAIATRRIAISHEGSEEPHTWLYGWRALAIGCAALVVAAIFFASAAGGIDWSGLTLGGKQ
jgi:hypothetical protein